MLLRYARTRSQSDTGQHNMCCRCACLRSLCCNMHTHLCFIDRVKKDDMSVHPSVSDGNSSAKSDARKWILYRTLCRTTLKAISFTHGLLWAFIVSLGHAIYIEYVRKRPRRKTCAVSFTSRRIETVFITVMKKKNHKLFVMKHDYGMNSQGRSKTNTGLYLSN